MQLDENLLTGRWQALGSPPPAQLADSRLQLHWAAQIPAAVSNTLNERRPDDSHSSLQWVENPGALACQALPDKRRLAMEPKTLSLVVLDASGEAGPWFMMNGGRISAVHEWAAARFLDGGELQFPDHELPPHPVGDGRPFEAADTAALAEIGRWFGNAAVVFDQVVEQLPGASPVRCWPHHFDIATLIKLDGPEADAENARSIGFGMSPGDDTFPEPYYYVLPWPPPAKDGLPQLKAGRWERDAFIGPLLPAADIVKNEEPARQVETVATFVRSAWQAGQDIL